MSFKKMVFFVKSFFANIKIREPDIGAVIGTNIYPACTVFPRLKRVYVVTPC